MSPDATFNFAEKVKHCPTTKDAKFYVSWIVTTDEAKYVNTAYDFEVARRHGEVVGKKHNRRV